MNDVAIGHLSVSQTSLSGTDLQSSGYDIVFAAVSWETRSLAQTTRLAATGIAVNLLRFSSSSDSANRLKDERQRAFLGEVPKGSGVISLAASGESTQNFRAIESVIAEKFAAIKRPLRVLIDVSCLPKRYMLFVVGLLFRREYASSVEVLYSEGKYVLPAASAANGAGLVSVGDWSSVQVPYMEGADYVPSERDLVVSIGAEISAIAPFVDRIEPRALRILKIRNERARFPQALPASEQRALQALTKHPNATSSIFANEDAVAVALDVIAFRGTGRATTCLAVGSKPHALGLGLAGLAHDNIEVCCRTPASYTEMDVLPTGRTFSYLLRDRFDPRAYLA